MSLRIFIAAIAVWVSSAVFADEPIPMKWTVAGTERVALVFPPATSTKAKAPVIFAFHGHGGNMRFAARGMHFQDAWPEALVVYMQGLPTPGLMHDEQGTRPGWQHNPGELHDRDLKFFDAVLATLHEKYSVDDNRIYATGFSNGGFFTYLLWATRPNIFAAFAPGAGLILPSSRPTQPRPVLHYGGRRDRMVKFNNQQRTIDELRKLNGCASNSEPCGMFCTRYASSARSPVVTFIHPAGHIYPPAVTELIVNFFRQYSR